MKYTIYAIKEFGIIIYIGQTRQTLHNRFLGHRKINQSPLANRIRKNGNEAYLIIPIDYAISQKEAFKKEEFWTIFYSHIYNLVNTRLGTRMSEKERINLGHKLKGRIFTAEHIKHMKENQPSRVGKNNPMFGKSHSYKTKKLIGSRSYETISGKNNINSRPVLCITTNKHFDTVKEAGRFYGISDNTIRGNLKGRNAIGGKYNGIKLHWVYTDKK